MMLALGLTLVGAGCFPWPRIGEESRPVVAAPQAVPQTAPIKEPLVALPDTIIPVRNVEIKQSTDQGGLYKCTVSVTYPQFIVSSSTMGDENAESLNKINLAIAERAASSTFGPQDRKVDEMSIKLAASRYVQDCFDERVRMSEKFADYPRDSEWYKNMNVKIEYKGHGVASLSYYYEAYEGGAHPGHMTTFMNVLLKDGSPFTLKDLIEPKNLKDFVRAEKQQILDRSQGDENILFPENEADFKKLAADTSTSPVEEQLATYGDFNSFYLTPTAIITHYNEYEIAPYVSGAQEAVMAYDEIASWLKADGLLGFLTK